MKKSTLFQIIFSLGVVLVFGLGLLLALIEVTLPSVETLKEIHLQEPLRVYSRDHQLIAEFGEIHRIPVTLNQIPHQIVEATLATEDQRFFSHPGVDILGLFRAGIVVLLTGEKQQGGSTITMQVARNFFLTPEKKIIRKIKEILLAIRIDQVFSKDKILELYFNKVFYGHRSYGIAAAARTYYGKTLDRLTLSEIALLVGLPKAPSTLNPIANPRAAQERKNHVLERMLEEHKIDQTTYQAALKSPLTAHYHEARVTLSAPHVAEMVRQEMVKKFDEEAYTLGLEVYTTIDSHHQRIAHWALTKNIVEYDHRHGYRGPEQHWDEEIVLDSLEVFKARLKTLEVIHDLEPAIVLQIHENDVLVLSRKGEVVTLPWAGIQWARRQHIQSDQEGFDPLPQKVSEVLNCGDVIRIRQTLEKSWELSQVPLVESALVSLNPQDGAITSLVGGFSYQKSHFNRVVQAKRQAGSCFKPFVYSAALDKGLTLASLINDAPVVTSNESSLEEFWRPQNLSGKFYGPTRLRQALIRSRNLVSVRLLQLIGVPYAKRMITRFGFDKDQLPQDLSLALGTASVSPLQMARGYAVFANGGYRITPYLIDHIIDARGELIERAHPPVAASPDEDSPVKPENPLAPQVLTPSNVYLMNSVLQDVVCHGTARAALVLKRSDLAGKTGTTNDQKDAWFGGFNQNLVVVGWMGFDQSYSLYEYAVRAVLPMWIDFMRIALQDEPNSMRQVPDNIVTVRINKKTGLLTNKDDPQAMFEDFTASTVPTEYHEDTLNQ